MDRPKLLKAEAARRSATGSQPAIFADTGGRPKEGNTEKDCRNKEDQNRADVCCIYLPFGNGANETKVAISGTLMGGPMRQMTDGKQAGEEQKDCEQTCERGMCDPLRDNRFSSFLQADPIKQEACPGASQKWRAAIDGDQPFNVRRKAIRALISVSFNLLPNAGISPLMP